MPLLQFAIDYNFHLLKNDTTGFSLEGTQIKTGQKYLLNCKRLQDTFQKNEH